MLNTHKQKYEFFRKMQKLNDVQEIIFIILGFILASSILFYVLNKINIGAYYGN